MSEPLFSIIVIFGRGSLEPVLLSLLAQEGASLDIIGVAPDDSLKISDPRVKLIVAPAPNPARRRNLAVAASSGKYLAFIDDDAIAPKDWLARAKAIFEKSPGMAALGGTNVAPQNMSVREQLTDLILTDQYFGSGSRSYQSSGDAHPARPGELHLSNFFLRRDIFDLVKGFNEKIGYGAEDSEMVYIIKQKTNLDLWFFPEISVIHQRRAFGWELLKRNFRFRRQNGRLTWVYPDMYRWNFSLKAGLFLILLSFSLLIFVPPALFIYSYGIAYFCAFFWRSFWLLKMSKKWLSLLAPFAYFSHHLSYLFGLAAGLLEGLFKGRTAMKRLYGREDFDQTKTSGNL
jgi:glycosyltransferase involved in cell wall biosynthesis